MKKISKTIIFFGTDSFSLESLKSLILNRYNIAAVVTKPDSKKGRGQKITISDVKKIANENNIEVWQPNNVTDINESIKKLPSRPIGVLVSYGKIIPKSTIELFDTGIINVHPSLLPLYRGSSPIESVIKSSDTATGISIMKLTEKMDAGPIYKQTIYKLNENENRIDLKEKLAKLGAETLVSILPDIIEGKITPTTQDDKTATYCSLLNKKDSYLYPEKITASEAERKIRAYLGFPKTKILIFGKELVVTKAHIVDEPEDSMDIEFVDGKYLSIDEVIAPSGKTMNIKDFINGYS